MLVWRGGVRCSETPWGQGPPNNPAPRPTSVVGGNFEVTRTTRQKPSVYGHFFWWCFFPVVVIGGKWRGGVRCSETPWGQGRPNTTYPMGRLRVLHGLRCRWVGTVAVVVGGRGSRWGGGLSGRGKGYPCEGVGCGKGGWGECCWSRTLVGCRRVQTVNFPEVWISKVGTVTVVCKILQGLRRDNIWDHTVWEVRFCRFVVLLSDTVPWAIRSEGPGR